MKFNLFLTGAALIAGGLIANSNVVSAADAESTATLTTVQPTEHGDLELKAVPDFQFTRNVGNLSAVIAGEASSPITVNDARNNGAGWQLSARLGTFTNVAPDAGWYLDMGDGQVTTEKPALGNAATYHKSTLNVGSKDAVPVMKADVEAGLGLWSTTLSNPQLHTSGALAARLDSKSATITWTLSDAPTTSSVTE